MASRDTRQLHQGLTDRLGGEIADLLMDHLPRQPAADLATRDDVLATATVLRGEMAELRGELQGEMAELRSELRGEMAELRGEMAELRSELRGEMAELRSELRGEMAELRTGIRLDVAEQLRQQQRFLFTALTTTVVANAGVVAAVQLAG